MRNWYRISAKAGDPEASLEILDDIGKSWWNDDAVTAKQFIADLKAIDPAVKVLNVTVSSRGGDPFDAIAIANALRGERATGRTVKMHVISLAASAASLVLMAGDEINVADNALIMVHNPYGCFCGDADEMRTYAGTLDKIRDQIVATYQWRSSLSAEEILALMSAETYFDADEAIANGFATNKVTGQKVAAFLDAGVVSAMKVPDKYKPLIAAMVKTPAAPAPTPTPAPAPTGPANAMAAADVLRECKSAGFLDLAEELIGAQASAEQVTARLTTAKNEKAESDARVTQVRALCASSKLDALADGYIKARMSIDDVRSHLLTVTARLDTARIDNNLPTDPSPKPASVLNSADIYAQRNGQAGHKEK